jgi:hypothetical protein
MDVVIPIIEIEENPATFTFPWLLFGRIFLFLVVFTVISLYLFRSVRLLHLKFLSRGKSKKSLRALYTLLLMRLSTAGYAKKLPSQTALEYSKSYPELRGFASIYTMLRYRENYAPGEREKLWENLLSHYRRSASLYRKPGVFSALRRVFSLRGLYYL